MKYKVIDVESDYEEVETGTCELCMGTAYIDCVICSKRVFVISGNIAKSAYVSS